MVGRRCASAAGSAMSRRLLLHLATCIWAGTASAQVAINEIRTDNSGVETDEFFELAGPPGTSLAGLTYVVLGDGISSGSSGGCSGVIECVVSLGAFSIMADGVFAARNSAARPPALSGYDAAVVLKFENSDNVTHLLVSGFTGAEAEDLDTDDDGVLDVTPWTSILDSVGLTKGTAYSCPASGANEEWIYSASTVGPDGAFPPRHVYRCGSGWQLGAFRPVGRTDTPGPRNSNCPQTVVPTTWSNIKVLLR